MIGNFLSPEMLRAKIVSERYDSHRFLCDKKGPESRFFLQGLLTIRFVYRAKSTTSNINNIIIIIDHPTDDFHA